MIEDDSVLIECNEICNKFKKAIAIKIHSMPNIKTKVKEFDDVVNANFQGDKTPKEGVHHTCIVSISIDSVMKMEKKNYPQVYLEECKYRMKKTKMSKFINTELESESQSQSELESDTKLKSDSESDTE